MLADSSYLIASFKLYGPIFSVTKHIAALFEIFLRIFQSLKFFSGLILLNFILLTKISSSH